MEQRHVAHKVAQDLQASCEESRVTLSLIGWPSRLFFFFFLPADAEAGAHAFLCLTLSFSLHLSVHPSKNQFSCSNMDSFQVCTSLLQLLVARCNTAGFLIATSPLLPLADLALEWHSEALQVYNKVMLEGFQSPGLKQLNYKLYITH